ncbi:MAG: protein kinase [Acidobacteriota bacterium]|nr:protein kinase [Acidobacteriota bacterium]
MEKLQLTASHEAHHAVNSPLVTDTVLQDRYRIVRQLGRGGMGAVYEAVDQRLGITVALKETLSSESSMRKQFEHEARLLAGMQHPALPRVSDHFVEGNRAFLVMEYIGGTDLARIISQQPGPFPCDQVIAWADQLLDALIYLHTRDRQVIHRDIKPHNLKLTATGQIALLDFGLAKAQPSDASVTHSQAFYGYTRHYAPLEQIQDQRTDPRSDIYALGATLYHLLTGIKPPDAMVRASALLNAEPDPLSAANKIHAAVGPEISAILNKAMAQKPENRYETASEFREALRSMGRTKKVGVRVDVPINREVIADSEVTSARRAASVAEPKLVMVVSNKSFGPAGVTAVLVAVITVAGGIFYGSRGRLEAPVEAVNATPVNTVATQRQPAAGRKPERPRVSESAAIPLSKPRATENPVTPVAKTRSPGPVTPAERSHEKKNVVAVVKPAAIVKHLTLAKPAAIVKAHAISVHAKESPVAEARHNQRRVEAPSVRLPNADFRDRFSEPSADFRIRSYGAASVASPKFFRAADGSLIVKFSDGSTRVVRPGERSAQSGLSQR